MSAMASPQPTALFTPLDDGRFQPNELAVGPWDPGALHGGPPCGLVAGELARTIAAADLGVEFFPTRFTAELLRPVPTAPLEVRTVLRRPGRRICIADATVVDAEGTEVLAATLHAIRRQPFDREPAIDTPAPPTPAPPSEGIGLSNAMLDAPARFHNAGVEHASVEGRFESLGPAKDWMRLTVPLVEGRETTPLERVVAVADFGNGISKLFAMDEVLFINPDLSVFLHRLPVGEWVCLDAVTRLGDDGVGLAESLLFDEQGLIGRAVQMLLVEGR